MLDGLVGLIGRSKRNQTHFVLRLPLLCLISLYSLASLYGGLVGLIGRSKRNQTHFVLRLPLLCLISPYSLASLYGGLVGLIGRSPRSLSIRSRIAGFSVLYSKPPLIIHSLFCTMFLVFTLLHLFVVRVCTARKVHSLPRLPRLASLYGCCFSRPAARRRMVGGT